MDSSERTQVHEITDRLDRFAKWAKWVLGILFVVGGSLVTYNLKVENRLSALEGFEADISRDVDGLQESANVAAREASSQDRAIARMTVQIEAQSRTLARIDGSISDLAKYLRDERREQ